MYPEACWQRVTCLKVCPQIINFHYKPEAEKFYLRNALEYIKKINQSKLDSRDKHKRTLKNM